MKRLFSIIVFLLMGTLAFGEVTIETNRTELSTSQRFSLNINFINENRKDFTVEGMDNFEIRNRGNSNQLQIINGEKSQMLTESYLLSPKKEGTFQIKVLNKNKEVAKVEIKVVKGAVSTNNSDMEIISSIKSGATHYFGEKIVYVDKLFLATNNVYFRDRKMPSFGDFSQKDLTRTNRDGTFIGNEVTAKNGKRAIEVLTYEGIIEPTSSGKKSITSTVALLEDRNFGDEHRIANENIEINILPLPQEGKPANFQNVVGELEGDYTWNKDKVFLGESVVLNIKLYGNVNLDQIETIAKKQISRNDFNIFENVVFSDEKIENEKYHGEKTFEVAFIPKQAGDVTIPEIKIPYFNTKTKKYDNFIVQSKKIYVADISGGQSTNTNNSPTNTTNNSNNSNQGGNVGNTPLTNSTTNQTNTAPQVQNTSPTPTKQNSNISISEEIEIDTLDTADGKQGDFFGKYGKFIGILIFLQFLIILYLLKGKKKDVGTQKKFVKDLKNVNSDKEFYDLYCEIMKEHFDYTPKAHLEDRLVKNGASKEIVEVNREIEESIYSGKALDRNKIIKVLKKELNG